MALLEPSVWVKETITCEVLEVLFVDIDEFANLVKAIDTAPLIMRNKSNLIFAIMEQKQYE